MDKEILLRKHSSLLNIRRRIGKLLLQSEREGNKAGARRYQKLIFGINKNLRYLSKLYLKVGF